MEATLADGSDAGAAPGETLDRAITTAPGTGTLTLSAGAGCTPTAGGCRADFAFTLDRIEATRSGPVTVTWTAAAQVTSNSVAPVVTISVDP